MTAQPTALVISDDGAAVVISPEGTARHLDPRAAATGLQTVESEEQPRWVWWNKDTARRLVEIGVREIFVVGGDADEPGCYFDAIEFISAFIEHDDADDSGPRQVDHIGYTSYPDTHPFITNEQLHDALHAKQRLILDSGRTAHVSTQMCFSADQIRTWLRAERASGFTVPVHLGIPGVIDRTKLMTMGVRLGVGTSLRYLTKNKKALGKMMTQRSFEPDQLLKPLAGDLAELGIEGIHLYTFNQVAATEAWRSKILA